MHCAELTSKLGCSLLFLSLTRKAYEIGKLWLTHIIRACNKTQPQSQSVAFHSHSLFSEPYIAYQHLPGPERPGLVPAMATRVEAECSFTQDGDKAPAFPNAASCH